MRTVDPSFKAGVALFCEEGRSWGARGGRWAREVGGKQEVGWRTWGCESVTRPSSRPSDRGRFWALATLTRRIPHSPLPPSRCRLPSRHRLPLAVVSLLALVLSAPSPHSLCSSRAGARPALKLVSPRLTATQPRGYPAVGSPVWTSTSPPSRALKTHSCSLNIQSQTSFAPRALAALCSPSNEWAIQRLGEAGFKARLALSHCDSAPGQSHG